MPTPKYKISLKLPGKTYSKTADTILEALEQVKRPLFFKSKVVIKVQVGKLKSECWMYPFQLRKLFVNQICRLMLQKRLINALK
jgi:hypothetical protein